VSTTAAIVSAIPSRLTVESLSRSRGGGERHHHRRRRPEDPRVGRGRESHAGVPERRVAHEAGDREHDHRGQVAPGERRQRALDHAGGEHEQRRGDQRAQGRERDRAELGETELGEREAPAQIRATTNRRA
jgi:hypothetical protein